MEWPKNAPDTASVPGSTHPPRRKRKHPSADANQDLAFLLPGKIPASPRHEEPRSEEKEEWAEFVVGHGAGFPQRRGDAERFALWCCFSASLRLCGT